jgi:hypothetical protein
LSLKELSKMTLLIDCPEEVELDVVDVFEVFIG